MTKPATEMDADTTAQLPVGLSDRVLEPMDRISEVLFGLIMALTFTCTLGVVTAGDFKKFFQFRHRKRSPFNCGLGSFNSANSFGGVRMD